MQFFFWNSRSCSGVMLSSFFLSSSAFARSSALGSAMRHYFGCPLYKGSRFRKVSGFFGLEHIKDRFLALAMDADSNSRRSAQPVYRPLYLNYRGLKPRGVGGGH